MKILIQRVAHASVDVEGNTVGKIGTGLLAFIGCRSGDTAADVDYLVEKLLALRIFEDAEGRMNRSVQDIGGSVLAVSQFTLYADTRKGNRPGFSLAGDPATAQRLYEHALEKLRSVLGAERTASGIFGADMKVSLINDGPVTIELCSDAKFSKKDLPCTSSIP